MKYKIKCFNFYFWKIFVNYCKIYWDIFYVYVCALNCVFVLFNLDIKIKIMPKLKIICNFKYLTI